jgi:DNA-binding winged helix-turn-helix (wHTH) protein
MGVNSASKGLFNNRLAVGIAMLAIFSIASSFTKRSDRDLLAKQVNIIIRQIGHRLLLQSGDSTSRVLPVTEIEKGIFLLQFENEFDFDHDSLMMLSQALLPKTQFPSGYTVTVHECKTALIVYGFQMNNISPDILACRGRSQPPGCYTIEIAFPDLYETAAQNKPGIHPVAEELESVKVDPQQANPIAIGTEEIKTTTLDHDTDQLTDEAQSVKVDPQQAIGTEEFIPIAIGTATSDYPLINLVYIGIVVLLGVTLLIVRFGKILKPVPVRDQNHAIIKESVPDVPALGKFLFAAKDQRLLLGSEVTSLTEKECRILELLHKNFGELIPREKLMQEVWINEGVITGRSLDMFVSKLRKKLSSDPELRITNVHGKGYKLEIPGMQVS